MTAYARYVLITVFVVIYCQTVTAQTGMQDIVYLKNGSVIKGMVMQMIPDSTIKIQTADSSIFIYPVSEVKKIEYIPALPAPSLTIEETKQKISEPSRKTFSIWGGVAIPSGDFGKEENGGANTGFTLGVQFASYNEIGWLIDASYSKNMYKLPSGINGEIGGWQSILILTGIKIGTSNSSEVKFYFSPLVGILFGTSPDIQFQYQTDSFNMSSGSSTAFAYGAAAEIIFNERILLGVRYIASNPKYNISLTWRSGVNTSTATSDIKQNTSIILIYLGAAL